MSLKQVILSVILWYFAVYSMAGNALPLDSVLAKAMTAAELNCGLIKSYEADVYMRTNVKTHKKNFLYKYTSLIPKFVIHDPKNDEGLIESISKLRFDAPDSYFQDVYYITGTLTKKSDIALLPFRFMSLDVYEESAPDEVFFMPLRKSTAKYYQYNLLHFDSDSAKASYTIAFKPLYKNSKLLEGFFVLEDKSWRVTQFNASGSDLFVDFYFEIKMGEDSIKKYLPANFNIYQTYSYLGNKVSNHYQAKLDYLNIKLNPPGDIKKNLNLGNRYKVRLDSVPLYNDSLFWNRARTIPLEQGEVELLRKFDEKRAEELALQQNQDSVEVKSNTAFKFARNLVMNTNYRYKSTVIGYSGILNPSMIGYSTQDGFTYRQRFSLGFELKRHQRINVDAFAGYVFGRKEFYTGVTSVWNYEPAKFGYLSLSFGKGNQSYSSLFLKAVQDSLQSKGINYNELGLNYFKDYYMRLYNSIEISNGLQLGAGIDYHIRQPKENQLPVTDIYPDGVDNMLKTRYYFVPILSLSWTPEQYYTMDKNQKVYVRSDYPTFKIQVAQSLKNIFGSTSQYNRVEFDINQNIRFSLMESLQYHIGTGFFTNQTTEYFADFSYFAKSYFPETWGDGLGGIFNVLPRKFYNASSSYVQAHIMYETPRLMLTRIPALSGGVVKERLYFSQLYTPTIMSYSEIGYGFGNRFLNAALFVAFHKLQYLDASFRMVFLL